MALKKNMLFWILLLLFIIAEMSLGISLKTSITSLFSPSLWAETIKEETVPPTVLHKTPPIYPKELEEEGVVGRVILEVFVMPDSSVVRVEVKKSIAELDSLAIETVSNWKFSPALRSGKPVFGSLLVNVDFFPEKPIDIPEKPLKTKVTELNIDELKKSINEKTMSQQEPLSHSLYRNSLLFYNENYHLISSDRKLPYITKESFSIVPSQSTPYHIFQNYYPFYTAELKPNCWVFESDDYRLPVTFTEAYMGIGYMNMDFGHFSVAKNDILDIQDLQLQTSMLFQNGYWMGNYEKSSNFFVDLKYPYKDHVFSWQSLSLNQETPSTKFMGYFDPLSAEQHSERIIDHSIRWNNPMVDSGLRYERLTLGKNSSGVRPERQIWQLSLNKHLRVDRHNFGLFWEHFMLDEEAKGFSAPYLRSKHNELFKVTYDYSGKNLKWDTMALRGLNYEFLAMGEVELKVKNITAFGSGGLISQMEQNTFIPFYYPEDAYYQQFVKSDYYVFFRYKSASNNVGLTYGQSEVRQLDSVSGNLVAPNSGIVVENGLFQREAELPYVKWNYQMTKELFGLEWTLQSDAKRGLATSLYYQPKWTLRHSIESRKNFKHQNAITVGLVHNYASEYAIPGEEIERTTVLDGYIRVSITPLFDVQADAKNILQTNRIYGSAVPGVHWNASVRWFFVN